MLLGADPISFAVVFAAGVVSFASPCVLPLVPAYIGFVSGVGLGEEAPRRRDVALPGSALLEQRRSLEIAGGIFVVAMGFLLLGRGVPAFLLRERRFHLANRPATLIGSGLAGVAFATGWTPCIGPTLAAALTIAANGGDPALGSALLLVYALGLGLPFLIAGLFLHQATAALAVVRPRLPMISAFGALVLIVFGVLLATGEMTRITAGLGSFGTPL